MGMNKERALETAKELVRSPEIMMTHWQQFNHCNAWVSGCIKNRFFLIKSYQTIVGIVDDQEADFFEIGKYSRTTSKQVTQIYNSMFSDCTRHYIEGRV